MVGKGIGRPRYLPTERRRKITPAEMVWQSRIRQSTKPSTARLLSSLRPEMPCVRCGSRKQGSGDDNCGDSGDQVRREGMAREVPPPPPLPGSRCGSGTTFWPVRCSTRCSTRFSVSSLIHLGRNTTTLLTSTVSSPPPPPLPLLHIIPSTPAPSHFGRRLG